MPSRRNKRRKLGRRAKEARPCSGCLQAKSEAEYSVSQWTLGGQDWNCYERKCLDCLPEEQEKEEAWKKAREEFLPARDKGYQFYEYPYDEFIFASERELVNLVGTYNIMYQMCDFVYDEGNEQRTTTGTFTLKIDSDSGKCVGEIERSDIEHKNKNKTLIDYSWSPYLNMTESDETDGLERFGMVMDVNGGTDWPDGLCAINVIQNRIACPWMCVEFPERHLQGPLLKDMGVSFDSLQEAETLAQNADVRSPHNSWIRNNLKLDAIVANRILEFASSWRPDPVLFFEPGDLHLHVYVEVAGQGIMECNLIARRQELQSES